MVNAVFDIRAMRVDKAVTGVKGLKPRLRAQPMAWPHAIGDILALVLAFINAMVHSRDGYTAVVPTGLILSAVVVIVLVITGWMGDAIGATRR